MKFILVPIFVCVVLPIALVLIIAYVRINSDNKRAMLINKALETNSGLDVATLVDSLKKPRKTASEIRSLRLLRGCIFSLVGFVFVIAGYSIPFSGDIAEISVAAGYSSIAVGVSYLIVYFVTRGQAGSQE